MAKGPFHFKRFSVEQDGDAMKVGTDGIVLGCWTSVEGVQLAVVVGSGNGYVGIMLMQRMVSGGTVIGVELEPEAAEQTRWNYAQQPFTACEGHAWHGPIQSFAAEHPDMVGQVDLMVSNPPYFRNKPKSPIEARNLARHDDTLTMGDLVKAARASLKPGGRLVTIWPFDRLDEWNGWADGSGFRIRQTVHIHTMRHLPPKRFLSEWTKGEGPSAHTMETLTLEGSATLDFTDEYLSIVRPYLRGT